MTERKQSRFRFPSVSVFGLLDQMDFTRAKTPEEIRSREIIEKRLGELQKNKPTQEKSST